MKTMKDLANNVLAVQNACNLSGVVHSFSEDLSTLRSLLEQEGKADTENINKHPVSVLYATQIAYLSGTSDIGCEDVELYRRSYEWAKKESGQEVVA